MEQSKNEEAEKIVGKRKTGGINIDEPAELGYKCPLCGDTYKTWPADKDCKDIDERLQWSEYNNFLWCSNCNIDIPSCLCIPNLSNLRGIERQFYQNNGLQDAIKIFLNSIENVVERRLKEKKIDRLLKDKSNFVSDNYGSEAADSGEYE